MIDAAEQVAIVVEFRDFVAPGVRLLEVAGTRDELAVRKLVEATRAPASGPPIFFLTVPAQGGPRAVRVDDTVTVGQLHDFANGAPLTMDSGGRGGGIIPLLSEWIEAGLDLAEVVGLLAGAAKVYDAAVYAPNRRVVREWMESEHGMEGAPGRALVRRVRRYEAYTVSEIERIYGVGTSDARAILKASGFRFSPVEERSGWGGPDYWVRVD